MKINQIIIALIISLVIASCSKPVDATYERFFFRNDGADLAVQVDGNRASKIFILLLHGGPGGSGYEYNTGQYAEALEKDYAMVYLDQRGQGASQGNYKAEDVTLQQFSDDAAALVKFLKQKYGQDISVFLMGHSWGGTTGTHALLNTTIQDDIKGWIEVDGAHDIPLLNKEAIKMFLEIGNAQIALGKNTEKWTEIVEFANSVDTNNISVDEGGKINSYGGEAEGLLDEIAEGEYGNLSHRFLASPIASIAGMVSSLSTANEVMAETEATAMTDELHKITTPSLFLWGKYDFIVAPALAHSAYDRISSTVKKTVIFEKSGHSPMDNEPTLFVEEVVEFVEANK